MNTEVLKKYTRWAILALLGLLITIGGLINDKPTQERNTDEALREVGDLQQKEIQRSAGSPRTSTAPYRYRKIIKGIREAERGRQTGNQPINPGGLPEYADNEGQQATHSYSLLLPGGDLRDDSSLHNITDDIFDKSGVEFKTTAYTAGYESTGKHPGDPLYGITYSGKEVKENHTVAADPDVLPIGTVIQIEGLPGTYVVEDKGSGVNGQHIDIYMEDLDDAKEYGLQYRRIIIVAKSTIND